MKWISLFKDSSRSQAVLGLLLGVAAFLLSFCLAVISIVNSPSVYQSSYKQGCVVSSVDIDSDNYTVYYSAVTDYITGNSEIAKEAIVKITVGDSLEKINAFTQTDEILLSNFASVYKALCIIIALSAVFIVASLIVIALKKRKDGISKTAIWMLASFIICVLCLYLANGILDLLGCNVAYSYFRLLSFDGILTYNTGTLAMLCGTLTMDVFVSAMLTTMLVFSGVVLIIILTLVNLKFKKNNDINDDFLYQ